MDKIVFCTLRDNKGATGGPAGVLYLQKSVLGDSISGCHCEYWFNTFVSNNIFKKILNKFCFLFKCLYKNDTYFFTHDITSGWFLSLLRKRYSLVYHSQGPSIEESMNLGKKYGKLSGCFLRYRERMAFTHANTLHFPSMGAAEMYFDSKYAACSREEVNLCKPLYNIIPQAIVQKPKDFPLDKDENILTFFSLGTLTIAKGQDQTVEFIAEFVKYYKKPIRYIFVGKGPLKKMLIKRLDEIKSGYPFFTYCFFDALPHDTVMYLHQISDVYIMLHRISIFDFATLEAMSQGSAVVLSRIGGNPEFNRNDNVVFAEDALKDMKKFAETDFLALKKKNEDVFRRDFSEEAFRKQYEIFFSSID